MTTKLRESYWGAWNQPAPSSMQRRVLNWNILSRFYSPIKKDFQFCITSQDHNNILVCEAAYLILLGYSNSPHASDACKQWRRIRSWFKETDGRCTYEEYKTARKNVNEVSGEPAKIKHDHALSFILNFAKECGDRMPTKEGTCRFFAQDFIIVVLICVYCHFTLVGSIGAEKFVVPYSDSKAFHDEYLIYCSNVQALINEQASLSTFKRAYQYAYANHGIRMMNCKGAINTCEICNNASDLLRNSKYNYKVIISIYYFDI